MAAGLTEKEAMAKAIIAGNAIASLDGLFSGLAGGNQKVLSNLAGFKQQVINIVKKDGDGLGEDQRITPGQIYRASILKIDTAKNGKAGGCPNCYLQQLKSNCKRWPRSQ